MQGLGYLRAQGHPVPVGRVTVVVGLASVLNALAGGHSALVSRTTTPLVGGADAGPAACRYWAAVVSGLLVLLFVLAAAPLVRLITVLPPGYTMAVTGLALLPAFQNALEVATADQCRTGRAVAFVVAASPVSALGLPAAAWALVAGVLVSGCLERADLLATWRGAAADGRHGSAEAGSAPAQADASWRHGACEPRRDASGTLPAPQLA